VNEMPRDLSEEAVARWVGDLVECDEVRPSALRYTAQAFLALVRAKVREAVDVCWGPARVGTGMTKDEIVARVLGEPAPPLRCKKCYGCGYIPGTYERPECDACMGTGREEVRRG